MSHRTFNETARAVGFVNFDSRGSRDAKRPCVIFIQQLTADAFGRNSQAQLILKGVADPNLTITLCNIPPHISNQMFVQQVHMSTTGEFIAFTCSEATNPDSRPKLPMLFRLVKKKHTGIVTNHTPTLKVPAAQVPDLEAVDNFINAEEDLQGDLLQSLYFPQFASVGEVGSTHVICVCRAETGARTCYTVKLSNNNSGGFFNFSFLKRPKKLAAASTRHVPGTDLILACQHKMSDSPSVNVSVRHFSLHTVRNCGNFERIYEVALGPDLSRAWSSESLMNGYVFWDATTMEEVKLAKDNSLAAVNASSSNHYHLPSISCLVVAYILYDYPVRADACGANTEKEYVQRNVVRLFIFRPRNKHHGYSGNDWYIDLYFSKKNIAIFQISSLGQMCVLCPGYKSYFVDVKYFAHDVGPAVTFVQYLDPYSLAHQVKQSQTVVASAASSPHLRKASSSFIDGSAPPPSSSTTTTANSSPLTVPTATTALHAKAVPIPTKQIPLGAEHNLSSSAMMAQNSSSLQTNATMSRTIDSGSNSIGKSPSSQLPPVSPATMNNSTNATAGSTTTSPTTQFPPSPCGKKSLTIDKEKEEASKPQSFARLEESCFLGEKFPDCFTRSNCIPSKLPPVEVTCDQGKFVIFFSTHVSAVLFLENRRPIWQAVQYALLRDRSSRKRASWEKNHDGELAARGILSVMDRAAMSLIPRSSTIAAIAANLAAASSSGGNGAAPAPATNENDLTIIDDTQAASSSLIPVFQSMCTQLRDPVSILMEWIIAAAYLRLGSRQNPPPRLMFDFSAFYEGLIHPITLPRTTAHAKLRGWTHRTSLITGGTENVGVQRMVPVQPRDPFVKAVELRIDETLTYRQTLVQSFRQFIPHEELLLEKLFPSVYKIVRDLLHPVSYMPNASSTNYNRALPSSSSRNLLPSASRIESSAQRTSGSGGSSTTNETPSKPNQVNSKDSNNLNNNNNNNQSSNNNFFYQQANVNPDLLAVNEFCYLLCRLTALEILGIRVDEAKYPIISTSIIFVAVNSNALPFQAVARSIWQRTITNQPLDQFSVLLNPLSRFANKENNRLNVRVNSLIKRTTAFGSSSNYGSFFDKKTASEIQVPPPVQRSKMKIDIDGKLEGDSSSTTSAPATTSAKNPRENEQQNNQNNENEEPSSPNFCSPEKFISISEPRKFFPSFSPSLISDKPFGGTNLPYMFGTNTAFEIPKTAKSFLRDLRSEF